MADRYWVGGGSSANWNATGNTNWGTSSGTQDNASVPGSSDDVFFDGAGAAGNSASTISASITIKSLTVSAGYTETLTHNNNIVLYVGGNLTFVSGMTYTTTGNGARIEFIDTATLTSAGKTIQYLNMQAATKTLTVADDLTVARYLYQSLGTIDFTTNSITVTLNGQNINTLGSITFYNLTRTGPAGASSWLVYNSFTVSNNLVINGNSATTNRVLVASDTIGTARTITAANVSVTNADFRDITGAGAGSWDLSAITGGSGNCGGCTGITFTTADDYYYHEPEAGANSFSTLGKWFTATNGGGSVATQILPQDTLKFDSNSFDAGSKTVTQDMPRIGSVDWTGATNTPTWTTSTAASCFGSITLISGMTLTASTQGYTFEGRGSYTLTSAGKSWAKGFTLYAPGGTYTLQDAFTDTAGLTLMTCTFNANNNSVTVRNLNLNSATKAVTFGTGTWTITSNDVTVTGNIFIVNSAAGVSITTTGSTVKFTDSSSSLRTFAGGGKTYNNFWYAPGAGTGTLNVTGSNTFSDFKDDGTAAHSVLFTAATTTTLASMTLSGSSAGNLKTIGSITAATHTLTKTGGGSVSANYLSISYSIAAGTGVRWWAGGNSTNGGNNTGWLFNAPPHVLLYGVGGY